MNRDQEFQRHFNYDFDTDTYFSIKGDHEVLLYQIGEDYIVTRYTYEKGEKLYVGNNLDDAIRIATDAAEAIITI